jgi:hypothetical protein
MFYRELRQPWQPTAESQPATVISTRRAAPIVSAIAVALGCGPSFRAAHLSQPVSMSPMADATLGVEAGRVWVTDNILASGMGEDTALAVEIGITNGGKEPYSLSAASLSCWMELSPDLPGETLSLTPAGGGEGAFPEQSALDELKIGSATIAPGESRRYWVVFRGYPYDGSDVPRKITVTLPDARGRRVQLVIADPARGQLRWETKAPSLGMTFGLQNTALYAPGFSASAMAAQLAFVSRAGPIGYDLGLSARALIESKGRLASETSGFSGLGVTVHLMAPVVGWGSWQNPRQLQVYGGGEAQALTEVRHDAFSMTPARVYGALSVEGGLELDFGALAPAASPFPISFSGRALPRWAVRVGYTHWFVGGLNSGGYTTTFRLAW